MSNTTDAFFARLAERGHEPLLNSVSGNIRCDIEGVGSWYVVVKKGSMTVSRDTTEADCVITCSQEDFDRMVVGKQNPTTLYMQGKMKIKGNLVLSQMVQRLFPDESLSEENQA